jgi:hypothetical protein
MKITFGEGAFLVHCLWMAIGCVVVLLGADTREELRAAHFYSVLLLAMHAFLGWCMWRLRR